MAPLKPWVPTARSSSSAAAAGLAVGSAAKAAKRFGLAAQILASRSLTPRVRSTAMSAPSFWVEGAPCESTCTSMPASSISFNRKAPKS